MEKKKKNRKAVLVAAVLGMAAGLMVLIYPLVMDLYNDYKNSMAISSMTSVYDRYDDYAEEITMQHNEAERYNAWLSGDLENNNSIEPYDKQLSFDGGGVIGFLKIPSISLQMLIYHGTGDDTLAVGAGHLEGTSLPVGGVSTHSVITAHSGMKSMSAFDNLRKMKVGDLFTVTVLGRECTYVTDSIETVLPYETSSLQIVKGEDRVTLVTCTPYGINDHRLLVHGIRTETKDEDEVTDILVEVSEESVNPWDWFDIRRTPVIIAVLFAAAAGVILGVKNRRKD